MLNPSFTNDTISLFFIVACNNGWKQYKSYCYQYSNHQSRWIDARNRCKNIGADLTKITSRDVQDFVFRLRLLVDQKSFNIWIGLHQQIVQNTKSFIWTDGSLLGNFTFWSGGEPQPGQNICVEMLHSDNNGRWGTGECTPTTSKHSSYVCQKGMFSCFLPLSHTPECGKVERPRRSLPTPNLSRVFSLLAIIK